MMTDRDRRTIGAAVLVLFAVYLFTLGSLVGSAIDRDRACEEALKRPDPPKLISVE